MIDDGTKGRGRIPREENLPARFLRPCILSHEVTNGKIRSWYCLRMWETILFNGVEVVVTAMDLHTEKGELVYEADSQIKYFTYDIESSNIYCMPEVGSQGKIF